MRQYFKWTTVIVLLLFLINLSLSSEELSVQVKQATLRSKPSFLGKKIVNIPYATRLTVLSRKGAWIKVKYDAGKEAWVHKTATTKEKLKLVSGSKNTTVTDREQAIAGKGYNEQVEKEYKKKSSYNYKAVDHMQKSWNIPDDALEKFIKEGGLIAQEFEGGTK